MKGVINHSFSINLRIMRVLGLYPPEKQSRFFMLQAYVKYFLFIILVPILIFIRFVVDDELDAQQINYNAAYLAQAVGFTTKILPFIKNGQQIRKCINYFKDPYMAASSKEQRQIIEDCLRICRRNNKVFMVILTLAIITWNVQPFFMQGYRFPLDIWVPFSTTSGPKIYYSVYLFLATGVSYFSFTAIIDPLLGGLAYLVTGQLQVLKNNLQHLGDYVNIHETRPMKSDLYAKIIKCVDHHNMILNFVEQYEECFSLVVFSQFAGSAFVFCFFFLQLTMIESFDFNAFSSAVCVAVTMAQIYFYCYYGTLMSSENYDLTNSIYMGQWYEYDVRSRKALIVLMERSKRPMVVHAAGILELSLDTFTLILRRSYSLLAVMRNYNKL